MVIVIRTPAFARTYFSANALCGWPNGVRYEVRPKLRKRRLIKPREQETVQATAVKLTKKAFTVK